MHQIQLAPVKTRREILETSDIAHVTWREHYASIISAEQIEYMLQKYQSPRAIGQAIAEGYEYCLARRSGISVGYIGIKAGEPKGAMFLSKFYLLKEYRGMGYASDIAAQLAERCRLLRLSPIWLTVNRHNPSVAAYQKMGFSVAREQVADIGGGYVMDDFIMERPV